MSATYPEPDGLWTEGHSGTQTSRDRARGDSTSGRGKARQQALTAHLDHLGAWGATVVELRGEFPEWHHGQISSALSNLDRDGKAVLLAEKRGRAHVYVLPEHAGGRALAPRRQGSAAKAQEDRTRALDDNITLRAELLRLRDENSRLREILRGRQGRP